MNYLFVCSHTPETIIRFAPETVPVANKKNEGKILHRSFYVGSEILDEKFSDLDPRLRLLLLYFVGSKKSLRSQLCFTFLYICL
jgi:hypothetical protein